MGITGTGTVLLVGRSAGTAFLVRGDHLTVLPALTARRRSRSE
jgi:hypothetical protein